MTTTRGEPRAVIVLVVDDRELQIASIDPARRCDMGLVDDLLRLHLAARRLGIPIRIARLDDELRELVELAGLAGRLGT